jgi:membrane-bound ClpP family serine protease
VDFQPFLAEADDDLRTLGVGPAGRLRFRGLFTRALRRLDGADPLQAARAELAAAPAVPRLPPDLPPGLEARVTEARLDWIAAGVPAAAFTEPLSMRGATVFLVIGTLVIVLGIVVALTVSNCWCIGGFMAVAGLVLVTVGLIMYGRAKARGETL